MGQKPNDLCHLLGTRYPIIQAGMVWVSGGKLAAAVSEAGGLGIIGAGSMSPELLAHHVSKAQKLTQKPIAVNLPLLYSKVQEQLDVSLKAGVRIFFTSAGSPKTWTPYLKDKGCVVVHVTSTPELAIKCEAAGVDAVVAEGFEAGGHNGRDEITTLVLIPQVIRAVKIPVIAAGGIADGSAIAGMLALGASGVQIGTRFVATVESSAHQSFKDAVVKAGATSTFLTMKRLVPVRLLKNKFFNDISALEDRCAPKEEVAHLLGKGRAKLGMLEGNLDDGELEIGEVAGSIQDIPTVGDLMKRFIHEYEIARTRLPASLMAGG